MNLQRNIRVYYFQQIFAGLVFTLPIWVAFQRRFLSYEQMAWLQSASFLMGILLQLPTGALADIFGRKKIIMLGWAFAGLANVFTGFTTTSAGMVMGLIGVAVGTTFVSGADIALLYDSLKELGREKEFSRINAKGFLCYRSSMVIAIFFGGYLYSVFVGLPIILKGLALIIAMAGYYLATEPRLDTQKFTIQAYKGRLREGFAELFKTRYATALSIFYILVGGITWSCLFYYVNTLAKDVGFTEIEQSWLFSALYILTTIIVVWLTGRKKILNLKIVSLGFTTIMLLGLLPGILATKTTAILMLAALVLTGGARFAILDGFVNNVFASESRATALSTLNMLVTLLCALILFSLSKIQEIYLTTTIFSILGVITLLFVVPAMIYLMRVSASQQ